METEVNINMTRTLTDTLYSYGYIVTRKTDSLLLVTLKEYETPLVLIEEDDDLYFQLDIIELVHLQEDIDLYKLILKLNAEITPLSLAIDDTREEGDVLILVESLARNSIDDKELLGLIEMIESSIIRVAVVLKNYIKNISYTEEGEENLED